MRIQVNDVQLGELPDRLVDGITHVMKISENAEAFSHKGFRFADFHSETTNPLIMATCVAFAKHLPLEIGPDVIFNTILQGISQHVSRNPEHFRSVFVSHAGRKALTTRDDSLRLTGKWDNDWEGAIIDIGRQIGDDISGSSKEDIRRLIKTKFSTTTSAGQAAHASVFMDVVKAYYEYEVMTCCGIPWIDITGSKDDWATMQRTIEPLLLALKLDAWNADIQTILSHFVRALDMDVDVEHWNKIFKFYGPEGSGGVASVSGWIAKLFLYVKGGMNPLVGAPTENVEAKPGANPALAMTPWLDHAFWESAAHVHDETSYKPNKGTGKEGKGKGAVSTVDLADFPCGTTNTEFIWNYLGANIDMNLVAGLVGITITSEGALKPEVGWVIAQKQTHQRYPKNSGSYSTNHSNVP
jgi:Domain of unknown function (DUF4419)